MNSYNLPSKNCDEICSRCPIKKICSKSKEKSSEQESNYFGSKSGGLDSRLPFFIEDSSLKSNNGFSNPFSYMRGKTQYGSNYDFGDSYQNPSRDYSRNGFNGEYKGLNSFSTGSYSGKDDYASGTPNLFIRDYSKK
ncbi:Uncharacterised protein [uncultured archaeon]|nr:Uncharacterised protein [uncultured archaeon]